MDLHAVSAIKREFAQLSSGRHGSAVFAHLIQLEPDLWATGASDLFELYQTLNCRSMNASAEPWKITTALLRQRAVDALVTLGLVAALAPGLQAIARRLSWGADGPWSDAEEFGSDLVAEAWAVLGEVDAQIIVFPERTILRSVRRRMEALIDRERRRGRVETAISELDDPIDPTPVADLDLLALALTGIAGKVIPIESARLVFAHRVLGYSIPEIAAVAGSPRETVRRRSVHAEALLCAI
jgi:DNA-directed RNA polymerase specialized sigma24 family protein